MPVINNPGRPVPRRSGVQNQIRTGNNSAPPVPGIPGGKSGLMLTARDRVAPTGRTTPQSGIKAALSGGSGSSGRRFGPFSGTPT